MSDPWKSATGVRPGDLVTFKATGCLARVIGFNEFLQSIRIRFTCGCQIRLSNLGRKETEALLLSAGIVFANTANTHTIPHQLVKANEITKL